MTSAPAIGFEYRPSRRIAVVLVLVSLLAELAIAVSGAPLLLRFLLAITVIVGCHRAVRRLNLPVSAAGWGSQTGWTLRDTDGGDDPATLLSFRCMPGMVLLRLAGQRHGRLTLWLMPDNSDADIRRRLRMRLAVLQTAAKARD